MLVDVINKLPSDNETHTSCTLFALGFQSINEHDTIEEDDMNRDIYATPFLVFTKRVWEDMMGRKLIRLAYFPTSEQGLTEDITVVIGIKGFFSGDVLFGFETETARSVASLMMEEKVQNLDEVALSALGKLASTISDSAATMLSKAGYDCRINPPLIVQGKGSQVDYGKTTQLHAAFKSGLGQLHLRFGLSESQNCSQELVGLQQEHR